MAMTRAQTNRKIRQDSLREQLANQKHIEQVVESIKKLEELDTEMDSVSVSRSKGAINSRIKLVSKYLPDLKSIELSGDEDYPVQLAAYEIQFSDTPET